MYGLEAGQSAVGDIFNWFVKYLAPAAYTANGDPHANLTRDAERLRPGESGLLALDWNNGNRTILVDPLLSGLMVGQTLHTTAAGNVSGAGRGHRLRRPDDHQSLRGVRRGRSARSSIAAASPKRTPSSCRFTPTCATGR